MTEREMEVAERIAKALEKDFEIITKMRFVEIMEDLVEVIERERISNSK